MHDFMCRNPDDMTYQPLADRTRYFKEKKEGQEVMCREFEKLREETLQSAAAETAKRMLLKKKYSVEEIHVTKCIEGGNHAQFGSYGAQKGDGTAAISAEAQIDETVDVFLKNIRMENK